MTHALLRRLYITVTILTLIAVLSWSFSTPLYAADSNAELIERIEKMERDNKAMQKRLNKAEKRTKKRIKSIKRVLTANQERARFNGFLSAMATKNSKNIDVQFEGQGIDNNWSFSPDSIVGLQWDYRITDKTDATVQLVAKGAQGFDVEAEWMYLTYHISDRQKLRMGRLRNPLYHFSETLEVGYSYAWVRPPLDVYLPDVTSYEGISYIDQRQFNDWFYTFEARYGSIEEDITKVRGVYGLSVNINKDPWTFRALYGKSSKLFVKILPGDSSSSINYNTLSVVYDDSDWQVLFEVAHLIPDEKSLVVGNATAYLSVAKRFGKFTPYVLLGAGDSDKDTDDDKRDLALFQSGSIVAEYHQKSYSLGLRYELTPKVAFKVDVSHFYDFDGTGGRFDISDDVGIISASRVAELDDSTNLFTFGIDAIF